MIRSGLLAVLVAAAVVGGMRLLAVLAEADYRVVRVEGELTAVERDQVRVAVADGLGHAGARSMADVVDVVERLGWVREVRARRQWPDTLHVVVRSETPVARWGRDAWLSASGDVVSKGAFADAPALSTLPAINAARTDGAGAMEVFNRVSAAAAAADLRLAALTENNAGHWTATFADGVEVVLGRTALRERMERFVVVYGKRLRPEGREARRQGALPRADARYPNGVAVRWVDEAHGAQVDEPAPAPVALAAAFPSPWADGDAGGLGR